ncbi:hypothetical protein SEVIR_2G195500v4 [Setaria viridis]|uniref:J domain-containing protein n=1 Tax=Setaria viridis TaxID=4556 RepID=A0A4U6VSL5_SETVI|nr:chaperone protein dnaJ 20, chloroplastic-like [Setaria viridis]TKW32870.1 hypothetical protein SEVIR_2G195500v2 [Setaria viridis]
MSTSTIPIARCTARANNTARILGWRSHCKVKAVAETEWGSVSSGNKSDYYKVLSLEHSAAVGTEEIKRAFRRLALRYHPDLCPPSRRAESTEVFIQLRRAYETLSDPARRVVYDAELRTGEKATTAAAGFARDVWEAQLCMLRVRSERRQRARSGCRCD